MRRMVMGAIALMVVLSACEIRAEINVNDDGSGTFGFVFGMESLLFGTLPSDVDPIAQARQELQSDGLPWEIEDYRAEGLRGFRATLPFRSLDHLKQMMAEQARATGSSAFDVGEDGDFVLEKDASGGWIFRATGNTDLASGLGDLSNPLGENPFESPSFGADFGDPSMDFGGPGFSDPALNPGDPNVNLDEAPDLGFTSPFGDPSALPSELDAVLRFEFHVALPGDAATSNADETKADGGKTTFIWRVGLTQPGPAELTATTTPAAGGIPLVPIAGGLLVLGGGAYVFVRKRGGSITGPPPVLLEGLPPVNGSPLPPLEPEPASVGAPSPHETVEQPSLLDDLGY